MRRDHNRLQPMSYATPPVGNRARLTRIQVFASDAPASSEAVGETPPAYPTTNGIDTADLRKRLLSAGAGDLTDAELLALVLGRGAATREGNATAFDLARTLLEALGPLPKLARRDAREFGAVAGVGPTKAAALGALFELQRRIEVQRDGETRIQVCSPADVAALYGPKLRDERIEVFQVVFLNTANVVISDRVISRGGLAASIVEPRAVFQQAILENAAAVICLHNHPSGNPEPSREDVRVTKQLVEAGRLLGIPVHDHLIIAGATYTSLAERGLL